MAIQKMQKRTAFGRSFGVSFVLCPYAFLSFVLPCCHLCQSTRIGLAMKMEL